MLTQLNPPLPVHVLDRGAGQALAVIDYGPEHHLVWVTALDNGGEIWCAPNPRVRVQANWTLGRTKGSAGHQWAQALPAAPRAAATPCSCGLEEAALP